jgi:hypothetical protein
MRTKVEALSLATAIDIHADETARNICRAWALDSSISSAMSFYAEKIVLTDSEEDPNRNPNLLFIGQNTLAKSVLEDLSPGPAATQFPLEYRKALRHGYFMATHDHRPVVEIIQTDVFKSTYLPDKLNYMRIILPITLTGGLPALVIYSQFLGSQQSVASFERSDQRLTNHKKQMPDLADQTALARAPRSHLGI